MPLYSCLTPHVSCLSFSSFWLFASDLAPVLRCVRSHEVHGGGDQGEGGVTGVVAKPARVIVVSFVLKPTLGFYCCVRSYTLVLEVFQQVW